MSLTSFPNGISSFGSPITASPSLWMANGAKAYFVGGPLSSDDNKGTDYDRPLNRISNATVSKVKNSSTGSVEHGTRGAGDFVYVSTGTYAENVRIVQRDYARIIGAGIGICTIKPGDTPSSANTDALGQSQTITLTNESTQVTNIAFIVGSRGVHITGFTILGTGGTSAANAGFYIGDGTRISASNNWGSSQFQIYGNLLDGEGGTSGGWGFLWDGFGPGGIIHHNQVFRYASGGLLVNDGATRVTNGGTFYHNWIMACRGYGIRRTAAYAGGNSVYDSNRIFDDGGSALTNGILLGTISSGLGDFVVSNKIGTTNAPISVSDAQDRISDNSTSTAGSATVTYVSMA